MTLRQQKYKKNRIAGMNMYNAARAAGYSHNTATKAGSRLEAKMPSLCEWMDRQGLTDKKLALFLLQALEANKVIGYLHQYKKEGENGRPTKIGADEIISNEFLEVPDMPTRLKAAELILKTKGLLKEKIEHSGIGDTTIHIHPQKVLIFRDLKENDAASIAGTDNLHAEESPAGNRAEISV